MRAGSNVQDGCILHAYPGNETVVEEHGHIGHGAILHGCTVKRNALVGMNAVVNDNAVIGESAIVAALAFVKAEMIVPPRTLVAGVPARVLRVLTDDELAWKVEGTASYLELTRRSLATMRATSPLAAPEPGRRRIELPELLPLSARKARSGLTGAPCAPGLRHRRMTAFRIGSPEEIWIEPVSLRCAGAARPSRRSTRPGRASRVRWPRRSRDDRAAWERRFADALADFRFLPGGRILAGAGTGRRVTLFNCFVMGTIEDSLDGIFGALREGALTMQQGGGIGYDFSTLRPAGKPADAAGTIASGPVSFMHVWDAMCATVQSTGARRGAMMATLRCDHPDIEAFVAAKRQPGALTRFNLSVLVTDALLQRGRRRRRVAARVPGGRARAAHAAHGAGARARGRASSARPTSARSPASSSSTACARSTTSATPSASARPIPAARFRCRPTVRATSARST